MRILDLLTRDDILINPTVKTKGEAIDTLVALMDKTGALNDKEEYKKEILKRESLSTTGLGDNVAIPHAKTHAVKRAKLVAMTLKDGVDYESLDGLPSKLFFMIAAGDGANETHLEVLARLSQMLMDTDFKDSLIEAESADEFINLIEQKEDERLKKDEQKEVKTDSTYYDILAVTACPTGIAHTYMAQEALEKAAREMGVSIKVETNGSAGAKNVLSEKEIEHAKAIIIAADKNVEMERFDGKKLLSTKVQDGIHKPRKLIEDALNGKYSVYKHYGEKSSTNDYNKGAKLEIYKHLMNGVSHMLPFVIGGGILIALAFLLDDYSINPSNFGKNTPLAAIIKTIGETAFGFMLPVLAGFIAMSIGDRPALAVGFVGGMLANYGTNFQSAFNPEVEAVSGGFLGALFAGFMAGYLVLFLRKIFDKLPQSLEGLKPTLLFPFFGIGLIGLLMMFVNPFFATINTTITDMLTSMGQTKRVLLGIVVAAMMAIDMGGPFNKAAYVFGTASLASGNFEVMAAVMAGGMVPPLAIALASTFFKKKFTEKERRSAITNYIMGLSFITEGAIPFAASDPLRVIPSCVVGSATAGAISMLFDSKLRAPHGGIFVLPVIENPLGFLAAVVIGSVVGMLLLSVLKKNINE